MERIGRHAQLARKDTARTILPDSLNKLVQQLTAAVSNAWMGMFRKSQPDKKPKGSRNIPLSLRDHTAVPANCWPLLEAQEASANKWTATKPLAAKTQAAGIADLPELVEPLSPIQETINSASFLQRDKSPTSSLENKPSNKPDIELAVTLTSTPEVASTDTSLSTESREIQQTPTEHLATNSDRTANLDPINDYPDAPVSLVDKMADNQEMDLDATFVAGGKRAGSSVPEPQAKKANLKSLACAYKAKVEQTQAKLVLKKGGGPLNPQPS